jgi:hypothetical protein
MLMLLLLFTVLIKFFTNNVNGTAGFYADDCDNIWIPGQANYNDTLTQQITQFIPSSYKIKFTKKIGRAGLVEKLLLVYQNILYSPNSIITTGITILEFSQTKINTVLLRTAVTLDPPLNVEFNEFSSYRQLSYSADATRVTIVDSVGILWAYNVITGKGYKLTNLVNCGYWPIQKIFPDGLRIINCASNSTRTKLEVRSITTANPVITIITDPNNEQITHAAISPIGDRFLTVAGTRITVWDAHTYNVLATLSYPAPADQNSDSSLAGREAEFSSSDGSYITLRDDHSLVIFKNTHNNNWIVTYNMSAASNVWIEGIQMSDDHKTGLLTVESLGTILVDFMASSQLLPANDPESPMWIKKQGTNRIVAHDTTQEIFFVFDKPSNGEVIQRFVLLRKYDNIYVYDLFQDMTSIKSLNKSEPIKENHMTSLTCITWCPEQMINWKGEMINSKLTIKTENIPYEFQLVTGFDSLIFTRDSCFHNFTEMGWLPQNKIVTVNNLLQINSNYQLTSLRGLDAFNVQGTLDLYRCHNLVSLEYGIVIKKLRKLQVTACHTLTNLHGLESIKEITTFILRANRELRTLEGLNPGVEIKLFELQWPTKNFVLPTTHIPKTFAEEVVIFNSDRVLGVKPFLNQVCAPKKPWFGGRKCITCVSGAGGGCSYNGRVPCSGCGGSKHDRPFEY